MPLQPGTKIGHYDVTSLLGEGGMGQVWQATDTQLGREVSMGLRLPTRRGAGAPIRPVAIGTPGR